MMSKYGCIFLCVSMCQILFGTRADDSCNEGHFSRTVKHGTIDDLKGIQKHKSRVVSAYSDIGVPYLVVDEHEHRNKLERNLQCLQTESANGALCVTKGNGSIKLNGIIMRQEEDIIISHSSKIAELPEGILEPDLNKLATDITSIPEDTEKNVFKRNVENAQYQTRDVQSNPINATVEILVWTDFSFYKSFLNLEPQHSDDIERDILRYIATLITAADLRMRKGLSQDPSLKVSLVLSGVVICKTSNCSWFIDNYKTNNTVDNHVALNHFAEALKLDYLTKFSFRYDFAAALTRLDITDPSGHPIGVANADDICQVKEGKSSAVVEDQGAYSSVGTFVHELAHTLGSDHDGWFRSINCSSADGYIMSTLSPLTKNGFYFSPCSIKSMKENLRKPNASCVFDNPVPYNVEANLTDILPGQIYNTSQQCHQIYGTDFCLSVGTMLEDICYKMYCWDPFLPGVCSTKSPAALGTSCGPRMWCGGGECVYDQRAPNIQGVLVG